jgi:anti-sigma B factor antagonist
MEYNHEIIKEVLVLSMSGDLIGENNGPELIQLANDTIHNGITLCAVNLSEVRYMNSSGIGVLITLLTKFRNQEGELILIKPSENIQKLLLITKLNKIFTIVDNKDEAVEILTNHK